MGAGCGEGCASTFASAAGVSSSAPVVAAGEAHGSGSVNFASVTYSQAATRGNLTGTCTTTACHNDAADQVASEGRADTEPVGDNATKEGRAQNRRIEIKIEKRL